MNQIILKGVSLKMNGKEQPLKNILEIILFDAEQQNIDIKDASFQVDIPAQEKADSNSTGLTNVKELSRSLPTERPTEEDKGKELTEFRKGYLEGFFDGSQLILKGKEPPQLAHKQGKK